MHQTTCDTNRSPTTTLGGVSAHIPPINNPSEIERLFPEPFYRLVHGEAPFFPFVLREEKDMASVLEAPPS